MVGHGTSRGAALSESLESLVRRGHIREAIRRAREELSRSQRRSDLDAQGRCHAALTLAYQYLGQHRESLLSAQQAISCFEGAGNESGLGVVLTRAAVDLAQLGDAAEAMKLLTRALEISRRVDDPQLSFRLWNNLAHAQRHLGRYQEALSAVTHAIDVADRMGDGQASGHARSNAVAYTLEFAATLLTSGELPGGLESLERGQRQLDEMLTQCRQEGWPHLVPDMARAAGKALSAAGRQQEAVEYLTLGIQTAADLERRGDLVDLTLDLAVLERLDGRIDSAERTLHEVEQLLDVVDSDQARILFHQERSRVCQARADYARALLHHQAFHDLTIARMQRLTDTRAQVLAIRLGNESAIHDAEMMRRRAQRLEGDVAILSDEKARLASMARQDSLTEVGNRRAFDEQFLALRPDEVHRAALLLLDLDHFKAINDTFGHSMGDEVLREIGRVLTQACRPEDVVCRLGGEEFIVLARNVDLQESHVIADRLRAAIEEHSWHNLNPQLRVTASIGIAMCDSGSRDITIAEADRALYTAKDLGRNRVVSATFPAPAAATGIQELEPRVTTLPKPLLMQQGSRLS